MNAGEYSLRTSIPLRADRTKTFDAGPNAVQATGSHHAWMNGNAAAMDVFIESESPRPCTIVSVEFIGQYASRMN